MAEEICLSLNSYVVVCYTLHFLDHASSMPKREVNFVSFYFCDLVSKLFVQRIARSLKLNVSFLNFKFNALYYVKV
jgi:hypothetical protein